MSRTTTTGQRQARLAVVIVNFRTAPLVVQCLESLAPQVDPELDRVVVVDNASGDGSPEAIAAALDVRGYRRWVDLVTAPANLGFSAGNNFGVRQVDANAYLLLNSDTIVRPGALAVLLEALEAHPRVGLLSPRLEWPDGTPQPSCFRYHSPASELINAAATGPVTRLLGVYDVPMQPSERPTSFEWTSFACVLIRRDVFERVGLMDEGYFLYYEDVDFCRRARQAGFETLHWPEARVAHLRGGSGPVKELSAARRRRPEYYYASRARYFGKFFGTGGLWAANVAWLAGRGISWMRERVEGRPTHICESESRDIWRHAWRPLSMR